MNRVRKFIDLPVLRKLMLLEALLELARASVLLRFQPWRTASQGLMVFAGREDPPIGACIGTSVRIVARYAPWRPTCLRQAIAAQRMLRRRGLAGQVRISFPNPQDVTQAHAWVMSGPTQILG